MRKLESRPKYRLVQDLIRAGIDDGSLTDGNKLPSEHDMARGFGVAYMTVRAAVNELVKEGLLRRIHGKGTFVTESSAPKASAPVLALMVPSLPALWNVAGLYYFPSIVQGFCAEATRLGYEPTVIGRAKDALSSAPGDFTGLAGAACLLISRDDRASIEALRDARLPAVGINAYQGRRAISYVAADQAGGTADAVALLAGLGHRRVAFLPGPTGNLGAEERLQGFRRAAAEHNLEPVAAESDGADYTDIWGKAGTERLLAQPDPPTAIITAGDLIAAGALQAVRGARLAVPGDISVVGFGDFHLARHLQPALTTVRLPLSELGAEAASLLHAHITGVRKQQTVLLRTDLVHRESVAPPRRR